MKIYRLLTRFFSSSFTFKTAAVCRFIVSFLLCTGSASLCFAAPGELDTSFGSGGKVITTNNTDARAMVLQADGKIVVVGWTSSGQFSDLAIVRYNANGSLDQGFGTGGMVITSVGANSDFASAVAIQPDGKIVIAGYTDTTGGAFYNFAVVRLNTDGSLDTSFDGDGKVTTAANNANSSAYAIDLQGDGKIVVAGRSSGGGGNFAVVRYNTDGTLDLSFDGDGQVATPVGTAFDSISTVKIQPDGKIIAAGQVDVGSLSKWGVVRYNANGSLDTGFDTDGKLIGSFRTGNDFVKSLALQSDGKIVLAGGSRNTASQYDFALARLTAAGAFDTSFDTDGIVITPVRFSSSAGAVSIQSNGKIIAAGDSDASSSISSRDFAVVRYSADGLLDSGFGSGGIVTTDITGDFEAAFSSAIQSDGKITVAGEKTNGHVLARYLGDPVTARRAPFDFDGDNKTDISIFRPSVGEWWLNRSSTGVTVAAQFGNSSDKPVPADFTGDGKTDIAFFRSSTGEWFILRSEDSSFLSFPFGTNGDVPVVGDFDSDGKSDVGVFRPSSNEWFISKSTGGTIIITFGVSGDVPVTADYDSDGRNDIAIYRPSVGQWWIQRSSNLSVYAFQFGASSDKPVQGDYTGDGKADAAFFRPSSGEWFILRSEDSSFYSVPFGTSGDLPSPGDYDGDGKFDPAVFRPSTAEWFVLRSTAGILITTFGTTGDHPIPNAFVP